MFQRGTLQEELNRRRLNNDKMDEDRVLRLFYETCLAVKEFHSLVPPYAHR